MYVYKRTRQLAEEAQAVVECERSRSGIVS